MTTPKPPVINDRISRSAVYMEPALHDLLTREAALEDESVSNWLRKLVLKELNARGKVPFDLLMQLAER